MNQLIYTLFCISMLVLACSTQEDEQKVASNDISGTWILEKYCYSPGDITCPWNYPEEDYTITFNADNTYVSDGILSNCGGSYAQMGSEEQGYYLDMHSHTTGGCSDHTLYLAFLEDGRINLGQTCDEECSHIYKRK